MDLLLQLIAKKKVSINDVPIMEIIEQYLDYVRQMQDDNLEVSSEFLEMAARLLYIKTVSLLPVHEEAEKLVEELRGELTEYQDCKMVAGKLQNQAKGFEFYARPPEEIEVDMDWLDPELISSENSNATENTNTTETINQNADDSNPSDKPEETEKVEESKKDKC